MIPDSFILKLLMVPNAEKADLKNTFLVFIAALLLVHVIQWIHRFCREIQTLPPGPWGIPIFGYLTFMGTEKHTRFMELAKSYGSVYSARLGQQMTVVMSDYKMIRELFRKEEFTGRPDTPFLKTLNGFGKYKKKTEKTNWNRILSNNIEKH